MTDDENFNSHAHVERDVSFLWCRFKTPNFNSHAHVERDFKLRAKCNSVCYFNSHAHVERAFGGVLCVVHLGNFNSHAHVERDVYVFEGRLSVDISTHTLTWSVTENLKSCYAYSIISTHTLTWSVTFALINIVISQRISTHTLTWSVTLDFPVCSTQYSFQLTRSRGA